MKVFTEEFVNAVNLEIAAQLGQNGSATRKTVCKALDLEGYESCISVLLEQGQLPDYRAVKRLGIVSAGYQTGKEKKAAEKKEEPAPRQLHPNVVAKREQAATPVS
jgi:hypothetical protein